MIECNCASQVQIKSKTRAVVIENQYFGLFSNNVPSDHYCKGTWP